MKINVSPTARIALTASVLNAAVVVAAMVSLHTAAAPAKAVELNTVPAVVHADASEVELPPPGCFIAYTGERVCVATEGSNLDTICLFPTELGWVTEDRTDCVEFRPYYGE